jgi:hypothetical protein
MLFKTPLAIWFGILTIISLFLTAFFGAATIYLKKNMFRQHKIFAIITVCLALIHLVLAVLLWFFGKAI